MRTYIPATIVGRSALLLIILPALLSGGKNHDWKSGKVLDSTTSRTNIQSENTSPLGQSLPPSMRNTALVIVGDEFAYTVSDTHTQAGFSTAHEAIIQAIGNRHHGCRFIVGDEVRFYQSGKTTLHVIDADGKECKTEILRQKRLK